MFITFEGIEGCGKTTLINKLMDYLKKKGLDAVRTREPGGSRLGGSLRSILLNSEYSINPAAELYLFMADRSQHIEEVILPALKAQKIVLCDRYSDSTIAYQSYGRGLDINLIRNASIFANLMPDITFLLDLPVPLALERVRKRNSNKLEDKFDSEDAGFHERVRSGYLHLARQDNKRIRIIDASKNIDCVFNACADELPF